MADYPSAVNYSTLADFCAGVLATVSGIGQIHKKSIHLLDLEQITDAVTTGIGDARRINAWIVYREGVQDQRDGAPFGEGFRLHKFVIRGIYQLVEADGTEVIFQDLIDSILAAFEVRLTRLNEGDPQITEYTFPVNVRRIGHSNFCGYLVHVCEISVVYRERRKAINRI